MKTYSNDKTNPCYINPADIFKISENIVAVGKRSDGAFSVIYTGNNAPDLSCFPDIVFVVQKEAGKTDFFDDMDMFDE